MMEEIYNEYHDKIRNYVRSKISNSWDVEELTSEIFLKICKNKDTFDSSKAARSTWVYTIARNTVIDYLRTKKYEQILPVEIEDKHEIDESILKNEMLELLADALEELDERSRMIIIQHYYNEISLKELAQKLGMSYSNIKIIHHKALQKMKLGLKDSR